MTEPGGNRRSLRSGCHFELAQDVGDMDSGRALADDQRFGDSPIGVSVRDEDEDLTLPGGSIRSARMGGQAALTWFGEQLSYGSFALLQPTPWANSSSARAL